MAISDNLSVPPELMADVERYAVYRCYSDAGQLLYVGVTGRVGRRLGDHIQKAWFSQVRGMTFEWHLDELDALNAERRAIHVEHPKYNVVHRNAAVTLPAAPVRQPGPARRAASKKARRKASPTPKEARAEADAILAAEPGITGAELGKRVGMGERWGQLRKQEHALRNGLRAVESA